MLKIECCGLTAAQTKQIIEKNFGDKVEALADPDMVAAKKVKSGEIKRIDTSSMLHDAPNEEDTEEHLAKLKMLNSLKLNVDKANRYIHTKEYGDSFKNE